MNDPLLDSFAELVVARHDEIIDCMERAASRDAEVPKSYKSLQAELATLDPRALEMLLKCVRMTANGVLAAALFTVFEFADTGNWDITIKGKKLSDLTPGLHYELTLEGGWLRRFSNHGRPGGSA